MAGAAIAVAAAVVDRRSARIDGALLLAAYVGVVVTFALAGPG